jgi:hypothetical protein
MSMTKRTLLASGVTLALASTARAERPEGSNQMEDVLLDHQGLLLETGGQMSEKKLNAAGVAAVKNYGVQMPTGYAMFYREGDNNYMLTNQRMANGGMLFDKRDEWWERS